MRQLAIEAKNGNAHAVSAQEKCTSRSSDQATRTGCDLQASIAVDTASPRGNRLRTLRQGVGGQNSTPHQCTVTSFVTFPVVWCDVLS